MFMLRLKGETDQSSRIALSGMRPNLVTFSFIRTPSILKLANFIAGGY